MNLGIYGNNLGAYERAMRGASEYYVGANTRKQLAAVEAKASSEEWVHENGETWIGLERNYLLYYTADNRELQVEDVSVDDRPGTPANQRSRSPIHASFSPYTLEQAYKDKERNYVSTGHTHGRYSFKWFEYIFNSFSTPYNARNINAPSNTSGPNQDYRNLFREDGRQYSAGIYPAFLATPFGYTIYSTSYRNDNNKWIILNPGKNVHSFSTGNINTVRPNNLNYPIQE